MFAYGLYTVETSQLTLVENRHTLTYSAIVGLDWRFTGELVHQVRHFKQTSGSTFNIIVCMFRPMQEL